MSQILLVHGDARRLPLADQSVHCLISSPPYWGLRLYDGIAPTRWGDETPCAHRWETPFSVNATNHTDKRRWQHTRNGRDEEQPIEKRVASLRTPVAQGQQCRDCGAWEGHLGNEPSADCLGWAQGVPPCSACYVCHLRTVMAECWRILRDDGTLWLNLGDSYANDAQWGGQTGGKHAQDLHGHPIGRRKRTTGLPPKSLIGLPWRVALALQQDGWLLRSEMIWAKPNPMPESVTDRPTRAHEQLFLFAKQARYFYDQEAVREDSTSNPVSVARRRRHDNGSVGTKALRGTTQGQSGCGFNVDHKGAQRNLRDVWTLATEPTPYAHFATMPTALVRRCLLAGTSAHGVCAACQAPWRRLVTSQRLLDGHIPVTGSFCQPTDPFRLPANGTGHARYSTHHQTTGWTPTCACDAPVTPAIVCDPFVGSGTVVQVAQQLGRHGVGADLSWPYLHDIARARTGLAAVAAWEGRNGHQPETTYADLPLFQGGAP